MQLHILRAGNNKETDMNIKRPGAKAILPPKKTRICKPTPLVLQTRLDIKLITQSTSITLHGKYYNESRPLNKLYKYLVIYFSVIFIFIHQITAKFPKRRASHNMQIIRRP